jgi:PAS domain S-box-containing protein
MRPPPTDSTIDRNDEISALISRLIETERRLHELTAGELDSILDPDGRSYLMRQAQEKLRQSEELFRSMFISTATGIAISTPDGRFLEANAAYCGMLGYTEDEMREKNFAALTHPDDLTLNLKLRDEVLAGQRDSFVMEKRYLKKDGAIVWTRHSVSAVRAVGGQIARLIVIAEDITERKRAEEALHESEDKFSKVFHSSPVAIALSTIEEGRYLDANDAFLQMLQRSRDEVIGHTSLELGVWAEPERAAAVAKIKEQGAVHNLEMKVRGRDRKITQILWSASMVVIGGQKYLLGVSRDVTEWKQIEARFRRLVESNAQAVFFWNTKGEIIGGNDAFLKITGYTREDLAAGRINWAAMTPPEYAGQDERALKELAAGGICSTYEKEWVRKDRSRVPILIGAAMFEDNPDEGVCFVFDLTERKKIEAQFRQAQKMEGIGQLASGVAHDFNNILAVIELQADLMKSEGDLSVAQLEFAREIAKATQHAANLTRQLLTFSRKQAMQPRDLDLSETINNMTNILRRTLGENIEMQFKFAMQPLFVHADAGMLNQVLLNLAVNARDAMPGGGRLVIETSAVEFDESTAAQSNQIRHGKFICLSVSDNGHGIPAENLPRIFDPFFTTKEVGKGTGLGLATVFGIVQQHNGWINVYSEPGHGATFRIYLPRLARIAERKFLPPALDSVRGGSETILLVEDEPALSTSVRVVLSRLGYRVLVAGNGREALEIWNQHRDEIQLVLTDMVMPGGIGGKQLGAKLLNENPKLKVIYASGYSAEVVDKDCPLTEGVNFLVKPFQSAKLAKIIRDNLDARTKPEISNDHGKMASQ